MSAQSAEFSDASLDSIRESQEASALGVDGLRNSGGDPALYKLIAVQNLLRGPDAAGPSVWRLTFKLKRLIPETADSEVGTGGEVFIRVDLSTREATVQGRGE